MMNTARPIDIILCSDKHQFVGIPALVRSVTLNAEHPATIVIHIVSQPGETDEISDVMRREFPSPGFRYDIREFGARYPALERYIRTAEGEQRTAIPQRATLINCSRFYFCDLFPELDRILYLDIDIIVQGDVAELMQEANLDQHDIAAVSLGQWKNYVFEHEAPCFRDVDFEQPGFNAGVFVARLNRWRENGVVPRLEYWMERWSDHFDEHAEELFCFGSQTVMNATFQGSFQALPRTWNVWGLGFGDELSQSDLDQARLLHWTGPGKPWTDEGFYKQRWERYALEEHATP